MKYSELSKSELIHLLKMRNSVNKRSWSLSEESEDDELTKHDERDIYFYRMKLNEDKVEALLQRIGDLYDSLNDIQSPKKSLENIESKLKIFEEIDSLKEKLEKHIKLSQKWGNLYFEIDRC